MPGLSDGQIAAARSVDLLSYLQAYEPGSIKKSGPGEHCLIEHDSLKISFEILMGLPVGWTETGHDGKLLSDSARYKALGNSIVTGCAEYIMFGIAKALREQEGD